MALKRWAVPSFVIDTDTELIAAQVGETVLFSFLISNYEVSDSAKITVKHTGTDGLTVIFEWNLTKSFGESPTAIDSPIVLEPGDKIIVQSNRVNVSVLANGEVR